MPYLDIEASQPIYHQPVTWPDALALKTLLKLPLSQNVQNEIANPLPIQHAYGVSRTASPLRARLPANLPIRQHIQEAKHLEWLTGFALLSSTGLLTLQEQHAIGLHAHPYPHSYQDNVHPRGVQQARPQWL